MHARQHQAQLHTMVEAQLHTIAATDSTSVLTELASRHPPLNSTGVPVGDGLRPASNAAWSRTERRWKSARRPAVSRPSSRYSCAPPYGRAMLVTQDPEQTY